MKIKKLLKEQEEQEEQEKILNDISKIVVWLDILKEISNKYIGKVDKLQFEERRRIINILVEKILVKITTDKVVEIDNLNNDTENSIKIDVFFRFEVSDLERN